MSAASIIIRVTAVIIGWILLSYTRIILGTIFTQLMYIYMTLRNTLYIRYTRVNRTIFCAVVVQDSDKGAGVDAQSWGINKTLRGLSNRSRELRSREKCVCICARETSWRDRVGGRIGTALALEPIEREREESRFSPLPTRLYVYNVTAG